MMETLATGLAFAEGPRWHDGAFWFSDMPDDRVFRIGSDGAVEVVCEVPCRPSIADNSDREECRESRSGKIVATQVSVAGAGLP